MKPFTCSDGYVCFDKNGIAELCSPFTPLMPILTSNETYAYSQSTPDNLDPTLATSVFVSDGRFTPNCQFITFTGPGVSSDYVSELDTIREAIFLKLQDYIYEISYSVTGKSFNPPKLYTVDPVLFRAYQVYDVCGNLAVLRGSSGKIRVYGFSKYLVLWSPDDLKITLTVTAVKQLSPVEAPCSILNPLVNGKHYICCGGRQVLVYENVYDPRTSLLTRIVVPKLRKANEIIRGQYFANFRIGCIPENPGLLRSGLPQPTTLTIEGNPTIKDFSAKWSLLLISPVNELIFCDTLYYWLQLDNKGQTSSSPITTTDTSGINDSIMASYIYVYVSGWVRMTISFEMDFFEGDFECGDGSFYRGKPLFVLIDYHTGNDVEIYDENLKSTGRSILKAETVSNQKITWKGTFIMKFTTGQFYWFKTTSVTKDSLLVTTAVASAIKGSFSISYLQTF